MKVPHERKVNATYIKLRTRGDLIFNHAFVVLILLVLSLPSYAQIADSASCALVRSLAEELMTAANLPGISIAISRDGAIIYTGGFGYADVELKKLVAPDTQFRT